jgi:anti-repressor protein
MSVPMIFKFPDVSPDAESSSSVRVIEVDGEPWFVARDVATLLGYAKPRNAVAEHCKGARIQGIPTAGGDQQVTIIPERDVYRLIMRSKLPAAERFEEWVVGEVLPSIRKKGSYSVGSAAIPQTYSEALRLAADQADQIEEQKTRLAEQAPKVDFVDKYVDASTGNKTFRQVCKLLSVNENRFREFLVDRSVIYYLNGEMTPFAQHLDAGRFSVKAGVSNHSDHVYNRMMFTPKGVTWIAGEWGKHVAGLNQQVMEQRSAKALSHAH